jgi:hypothetical protein
MDSKEIIIFAVVLAFVGAKLYQKYVKKDQSGIGKKGAGNSSLSSSSQDDDYEPYSKK